MISRKMVSNVVCDTFMWSLAMYVIAANVPMLRESNCKERPRSMRFGRGRKIESRYDLFVKPLTMDDPTSNEPAAGCLSVTIGICWQFATRERGQESCGRESGR